MHLSQLFYRSPCGTEFAGHRQSIKADYAKYIQSLQVGLFAEGLIILPRHHLKHALNFFATEGFDPKVFFLFFPPAREVKTIYQIALTHPIDTQEEAAKQSASSCAILVYIVWILRACFSTDWPQKLQPASMFQIIIYPKIWWQRKTAALSKYYRLQSSVSAGTGLDQETILPVNLMLEIGHRVFSISLMSQYVQIGKWIVLKFSRCLRYYKSSTYESHLSLSSMRTLTKTTLPYSKFLAIRPLFLFATSLACRNNVQPIFYRSQYQFGTNPPQKVHENVEKGEFKGDGFYVQQLLTGCLAIYSYYIQSGNEAFLIDPLNETDKYEQIIKSRGKTLKGVFLTHYHADYIAGHLELKKRHGCEIFLGPKALSSFGIKVLNDGDCIKVGDIKLKVIHTPGHTQQSSCLLLIDSKDKEQALFTGDTVFLNEVGRPDLAVKTNLSSSDLAAMLFDSLQKIKKLDDAIRVYPGHGSGSSCGKNIGKGDFCSLGTQRQNNYGLKQSNKEKFVRDVLNEMPNPPQYFGYNAGINKFKPFDYEEAQSQSLKKISAESLKSLVQTEKVTLIDARPIPDLKEGMIKQAVAVDFNGAFANWVGTVLPPTGTYVIIAPDEIAAQSVKRLLRIGYTNIKGYCSDNLGSLSKVLEVYKPDFVPTVNVEDRIIVDVRKPAQWQRGVAEGKVQKLELNDKFEQNAKKSLDKSKKYVVHCQSGYRARIAYSILKNQGFDVKVYGEGGFAQFDKIGVKTTIK